MNVTFALLGLATIFIVPLICVLCIVMEWGNERTIERVVVGSYAVGGLLASVFVVIGLVNP